MAESSQDVENALHDVVAELPTQVDKFTQALVKVKDLKVKIDTLDFHGKPTHLDVAPILVSELGYFPIGELARAEDFFVTASNDYLIASLLSASSRKYRLSESRTQIGSIRHGLYCDDNKYGEPIFEVPVLGACLQRLASGSYLYVPEGIYAGTIDILGALKLIQKEGVVQELLEATIQQAKLGFKLDVESENA